MINPVSYEHFVRRSDETGTYIVHTSWFSKVEIYLWLKEHHPECEGVGFIPSSRYCIMSIYEGEMVAFKPIPNEAAFTILPHDYRGLSIASELGLDK